MTDSTQSHVIADLQQEFRHLTDLGQQIDDQQLCDCAALAVDLLSLAAMLNEDSESRAQATEITDFCRTKAFPVLTCDDAADTSSSAAGLQQEIVDRWQDLLSLLSPEERCSGTSDSWSGRGDVAANADTAADFSPELPDELTAFDSLPSTEESPTAFDMSQILASLSGAMPHDDDVPEESVTVDRSASESFASSSPAGLPQAPTRCESIDDPEMLAAYVDDAQQCLAEMEGTLLNSETAAPSTEALRHFCRQLHTLKGASGTVGLSTLAGYLHDVETYIDDAGTRVDADQLFTAVDTVRQQLKSLGADESADTPVIASTPAATAPASATTSGPNDSDASVFVRVEASRLERLMDLLSELVMLRNRRDSHVDELRDLHRELNQCSVRTRGVISNVDLSFASQGVPDVTSGTAAKLLSCSLEEIAEDTAEVTRSLHKVFAPLSEENSAVSHLIGRFRQELMELRRQPLGGLFQRLQRAVREAARAERKQVVIHIEGQGARAERSLQERLYEPLLHLVRNGVSHGIEEAADRVGAGKPEAGQITLTATSDASQLCIEVRDDGRGLNDERLEKRGRELGLLHPGERPTQAQLWNLIFRPGFSTKAAVSDVSGRGVGMDVVDTWIRRLRGRIDVESQPGRGTVFRMRIPLRSGIEHAMVVRSGQQLFALPMHAIDGTTDSRTSDPIKQPIDRNNVVSLSRIFGRDGEQHETSYVTLRQTSEKAGNNLLSVPKPLTLAVDAVVGVEEVVVRSLPPMCQRNELFDGVTLSGRAETVLMLDVARLIELSPGRSFGAVAQNPEQTDSRKQNNGHQPCILVADDSLVIRRTLHRKFQAAGYSVREAANGHEALAVLRTQPVACVVTDIDMPGMNGVELLQEIRRNELFRTIPACVLTSRDRQTMPEEIAKLNPSAVLGKPIRDETIKTILRTFTTDAPASH